MRAKRRETFIRALDNRTRLVDPFWDTELRVFMFMCAAHGVSIGQRNARVQQQYGIDEARCLRYGRGLDFNAWAQAHKNGENHGQET
jgi:hypothetical protein